MSVLNLSRELVRRGHSVTIGFGAGEFLSGECQRQGIPMKRFENLGRSLSLFRNIRFILELRKFLKKERFDVMHINSSNALLGAIGSFSLLRNRPYTVFTYRGLSLLDEKHELSNLQRLFYRLVFRFLTFFVDKEVFVSNSNFESARLMGFGKNGVVIYNGFAVTKTSFLAKGLARQQLRKISGNAFKDEIIVGSIGRLEYPKNYEFLIRNWKSIRDVVPEAVCVIVGGGPDRDDLETMIKRQGIEDTFFLVGEYPHAASLLKGLDVFVLPSRYEGLSITTLEALFAGIPMLITKTGGNAEVVSGFDPFLFDVDERDEFKQKLIALLTQEKWKTKAREISKNESRRFCISRTAHAYEAVYRNST